MKLITLLESINKNFSIEITKPKRSVFDGYFDYKFYYKNTLLHKSYYYLEIDNKGFHSDATQNVLIFSIIEEKLNKKINSGLFGYKLTDYLENIYHLKHSFVDEIYKKDINHFLKFWSQNIENFLNTKFI